MSELGRPIATIRKPSSIGIRPRGVSAIREPCRTPHVLRGRGVEVTVHDSGLDRDGSCAVRLVALLERVLTGVSS